MGGDLKFFIRRDANNGLQWIICCIQSGESDDDLTSQNLCESVDPFVDGCVSRQRRLKRGYAETLYAMDMILSFLGEDCYLIFFDLLYFDIYCNHVIIYH